MIVQMVKSKVIKVCMLACITLGVLGMQMPAHAQQNVGPDIKASAAILVEASTGKIIYEKNIDQSLPIASMTKMMSAYLIQEAVKEGKLSWDDDILISEYVHKISQNTTLSNVPLEVGQTYKAKELYEASAIYSANGATIALAEKIAGSEHAFVDRMNKKAEELGLEGFKFVNSTGLNNADLQGNHHPKTSPTDENMLSARGCAQLAYHLMKDFPNVLDVASVPSLEFQANKYDPSKGKVLMKNWNWMLKGLVMEYEGMDGLKTGTTDAAGPSFTGTAKRGDVRFISVVMNATDRVTKEARFIETKKLLDYGFNNFEMKDAYPAGYAIEGKETLPVSKGKEDVVKIGTKEAMPVLVAKGSEAAYSPAYKLDESLLEDGKVAAPIEEGSKVGTVYLEGNDFLYKDMAQVDLVAQETVEKANWFMLSLYAIGDFFSSIWSTVIGWF
ncbi:D-alanyl-D-alanine carboxypeptidase (penicillin-binding protein 5/6) [Priestia taiwanensis]|uniref:serine-type D-Ala-D-Ala carboxypeptidase n=2 Tax=Priestia taiwanensis TaxID=1347902 RepID=A0A917AWZ6_9BACI|nr:serine hydrolase [Priestia taiwanensis]MBM7365289.1 D-alanyl-D-alanine carboxypeptidase (penicillin-binding protein 5/6) [Priestia taiwanensis]GGE85823.1 D-alanyl-D-alanine carboxypeptidase [Priestia taiwanensis]